MRWPLLRTEDLDLEDIESLLLEADRLRTEVPSRAEPMGTLALMFYEPSLRTRVGFAAAAHRVGLQPIDLLGPRDGTRTSVEPWSDSLRVVSNYADVIVARPGQVLHRAEVLADCHRPFINGGDQGEEAEHPTQALIDLLAMRTLSTREPPWTIAICGDPRMRSARSLVEILSRSSDARELLLVTDQRYLESYRPPAGCKPMATCTPKAAPWDSIDIVYVAGMPHQSLPLDLREQLIISASTLRRLPDDAIVLSPMPVIDEITDEARTDPRLRFHDQSALGLFVRMAVLKEAIASSAVADG